MAAAHDTNCQAEEIFPSQQVYTKTMGPLDEHKQMGRSWVSAVLKWTEFWV